MNLHFELGGLDWRGTGAQAIEANTDLFWEGVSEEVVSMYEDAVELVPSLLENAYAALWVNAGVYDLLVYSVADTGGDFPTDQSNAGLDVVLVKTGRGNGRGGAVEEHDQAVGIETAAEPVFDVMAYAERHRYSPAGNDEYVAPGGEPLSMVVADRGHVQQYLTEIETLVTEEAEEARWVATRGAGLGWPSEQYLVFPGPYWPMDHNNHSSEFTTEQHEALRERLAEHAGRSPWQVDNEQSASAD